jgi:hypothetical protein
MFRVSLIAHDRSAESGTANVPKPAPPRRYYFDSLNYKE